MTGRADNTIFAQERWYDTPQGAFALARELNLLRKMLSPWPRRGRKLLEVGCGGGRFLELFWESGFDVTGFDSAQELLDMARQRMGFRVELQLGAPDLLPWDDNAFDYVALAPLPERGFPHRAVVREAVRVAARGVLLRFWNPCSLPGLFRLLPCSSLTTVAKDRLWLSRRDYCDLLRSLSPGCAVAARSALYTPLWAWREGAHLSSLNNLTSPLPLGGIVILRMEHAPIRPLTPLPLRLGGLRAEGGCPATAPMGRTYDAQGADAYAAQHAAEGTTPL